MDADGTVFIGGGLFVSQYFSGIHCSNVSDGLWCEGVTSDVDLLFAAEFISDPCLYPDDVSGAVLYAAMAGDWAETHMETGTQTEADRVLHPVWGITFLLGGGGGSGEMYPFYVKKFPKNGRIDPVCGCFLCLLQLFY